MSSVVTLRSSARPDPWSHAADLLDPPAPRWPQPAQFAAELSRGRWQHAPHLDLLSKAIADTIANSGALIVSMPPRHGKSQLTSRNVPAWYLDRWPDRRVVLASYAATFAATWGRAVRNLVTEHQDQLDVRLAADSQSKSDWATTAGGGMLTVGVGGPITGRGADLLLVDDPVKNAAEAYSPTIRDTVWDWWTTTARTRLEPGGAMIVVMTRWHHDDLAGRLLAGMDDEHGDRWRELNLPAIAGVNDPLRRNEGQALWPVRYDVVDLDKIRHAVGPAAWQSLYQGTPTTDEGGIFPRSKWGWYDAPRWTVDQHGACWRLGLGPVWQSWDMAFKGNEDSDFVVGQVWTADGADRFLLDQVRGRWTFTETCDQVLKLSGRWPEATAKLVEDKANGTAVIDALNRTVGGMIPVEPQGSKLARAHAVSPLVHAGNVRLPDPHLAPWVNDLIEEAALFPAGANDDQVDATSQALAYDPWVPDAVVLDMRRQISPL